MYPKIKAIIRSSLNKCKFFFIVAIKSLNLKLINNRITIAMGSIKKFKNPIGGPALS